MKALIVEDDPELGYLWSEALDEIGASCEVARSNKDAMSLALRQKFDLIVLDLFIEDGTTVGISDWLSIRMPEVPILMITGSNMFPNGEHTQVAPGVRWLLRKPVKVVDLQVIAQHLCAAKQKVLSIEDAA